MESTNNPDTGTGYSVEEAATNIENILDSQEATILEEVDADSEFEDSQTPEADDVSDDAEQPIEDSDEVADEAEGETTDEVESPAETILDDEALVDVNGQQLPLKELRDGYLRRADYTKKTQELKQHMARYQVQQVEMADMRVAVTNDIAEMKRRIATELTLESFNPPDDSLYEIDPYEHGRKMLDYQRKQAAVKELHDAERLLAEQNALWEQKQFEVKQSAALEEFTAKYAEFAENTAHRLGELGSFLAENGFGREEIEGIADARILDIVYRLLKAETRAMQVPHAVKALEKRAQAVSPGTSKGASSTENGFQKDAQKYKRTGDFNDAVSAISKLL
ncbi:hypothetical protein ACQKGL_02120 [Ensifer adhaerens]|uniref:hypothetical protein n=1 Tax=Ensifer adhaerens TaxID=106592 RepID=UPI003D08B6E8